MAPPRASWVNRRLQSQGGKQPWLTLPSGHFPPRVLPCPSALRLWGAGFALIMRREPEDTVAQYQRTPRRTIRTFHAGDTTGEKTLRRDLHHTRKGAFLRWHRWHLLSYGIATCCTRNPGSCVGPRCRVRQGVPLQSPRGLNARARTAAGKRRGVGEQLLQLVRALGFGPFDFVLPRARLHFHPDALIRLQGMPRERLDG